MLSSCTSNMILAAWRLNSPIDTPLNCGSTDNWMIHQLLTARRHPTAISPGTIAMLRMMILRACEPGTGATTHDRPALQPVQAMTAIASKDGR